MKIEAKTSRKFQQVNALCRHVVSVMFVSAAYQVTYLFSYLGR